MLQYTRILLPVLGASAPNFILAAMFLITWIDPYRLGEKMVAYLMLVMLLEFIVVHSSAFMGSVAFSSEAPGRKAKGMLILGGFYTLFVGAFAAAFKTWWPLASFWLLTLNRLLGGMLGVAPSGREKEYMQRSWGSSVLFYVVFAGLTTVLPVPKFGITSAVRHAQDLPGSGEWISHPEKVIAFGFLYFLFSGISDLFQHRWMGQNAAATAADRSAA